MKIITVVGARPQFVKAATVSRALSNKQGVVEKIIHTGQHYDAAMSDVFFRDMEIAPPSFHLNVTETSHAAMTGKMMEKIEPVLVAENPDCVIVYGDTNTSLAATLAAKKINIKVAHVEAGLRSYNMAMPEEINRIVIDRISDFLFCPTAHAVANLEKENCGSSGGKLRMTGDVMYDAFLYYSKKAIKPGVDLPGRFALATIHRAGTTDDPQNLAKFIGMLNELHRGLPVVFPVHPRTAQKLKEYDLKTDFITCEPLRYFEMLYLLQKCDVVITDSGGLQKEAYFAGKHCVIMREETEWTELIDNKSNFLYHTLHPFHKMVIELAGNESSSAEKEIYGDGHAAEKIADILVKELN